MRCPAAPAASPRWGWAGARVDGMVVPCWLAIVGTQGQGMCPCSCHVIADACCAARTKQCLLAGCPPHPPTLLPLVCAGARVRHGASAGGQAGAHPRVPGGPRHQVGGPGRWVGGWVGGVGWGGWVMFVLGAGSPGRGCLHLLLHQQQHGPPCLLLPTRPVAPLPLPLPAVLPSGPRVLEHIVDTVIYMEGGRQQPVRMVSPPGHPWVPSAAAALCWCRNLGTAVKHRGGTLPDPTDQLPPPCPACPLPVPALPRCAPSRIGTAAPTRWGCLRCTTTACRWVGGCLLVVGVGGNQVVAVFLFPSAAGFCPPSRALLWRHHPPHHTQVVANPSAIFLSDRDLAPNVSSAVAGAAKASNKMVNSCQPLHCSSPCRCCLLAA